MTEPTLPERLRKRAEEVARDFGHPDPPEDDMNTADAVWFAAMDAADELDRLAAEIERLRAALTEVRDMHLPEWVSESAKAAGKEPWVCALCGTADGGWPCDTRIAVDEALGGPQ